MLSLEQLAELRVLYANSDLSNDGGVLDAAEAWVKLLAIAQGCGDMPAMVGVDHGGWFAAKFGGSLGLVFPTPEQAVAEKHRKMFA